LAAAACFKGQGDRGLLLVGSSKLNKEVLMVLHARPHLETHSRGAGHSAIAGVAYRLGLRLYDRRTDQWHDYRRRKLGEEIVRALTVAPDGAPDWATDPQELWERVEAAEKRKDAQVARDYRIPVPFGLTDDQAGDLAEEMARFICRELHTAVSMGLHRDAEVDALGNVKPKEKQGFHAHLYFPTRRLEEMGQEQGSSSWGLGPKLILLSNKNTSGAFVERLNEQWAELANRYTAKHGLTADYSHLSYVRQDLPVTPQPSLGAAVTAMERRGFFTRRGDALRGDILVPSKVYEAAHAIVLEVQREQAATDVAREAAAKTETPAAVVETTASAPATRVFTRPVRSATSPNPPLAVRFQATFSDRANDEAREAFLHLVKIVRVIERALGLPMALALRFASHQEHKDRRMAAKLDVTYQLDRARLQRTAAEARAHQWEADHPWRAASTKVFQGGAGAKPAPWQALLDEVQVQHRWVQSLKTTVRSHQAKLDVFVEQEAAMATEQGEAQQALKNALDEFVAISPTSVRTLLDVTYKDEGELIEAALPASVLAVPIPFKPEELELVSAAARLRPSPRP
jgi:hypothetical protein